MSATGRITGLVTNPYQIPETMKTLLVFLLTVFCLPIEVLHSQPLTDNTQESVRVEIENQHRQEQKAFADGECGKVVSFFDEKATIYANGRRISSLEVLKDFCNRVPRPFEGGGKIDDEIYVLSESAAHHIRVIDLEPEGEEGLTFKKEVITKVWSKTPAGWKIVHFHSSINTVSVR